MVDIEKQLKDAIKNSGLTRYQIAKASQVHEGVLSRFVHGKREIGIKTAAKIAKVLNLKLKKKRED
ncbi:MAG: helix-turn-helix transcriptional regulator [Phycisphaerae bacterium]